MRKRLLLMVNIALIPYVWLKFPREARDYTRGCFAAARSTHTEETK